MIFYDDTMSHCHRYVANIKYIFMEIQSCAECYDAIAHDSIFLCVFVPGILDQA